MPGHLYIIPCTLGEDGDMHHIPPVVTQTVPQCGAFVVEHARSARRWLRKAGYTADFNQVPFYEWDKHQQNTGLSTFIKQHAAQHNFGILSEAGCPCIADPGAEAVAIAHSMGLHVVPLSGPSSILLALMASGFSGQHFTFNGYLPVKQEQRIKTIKALEKRIMLHHEVQIFIETPYRNMALLNDLLSHTQSSLKLCLAVRLTCPDEEIRTMTIAAWRKHIPDLQKKEVVFVWYK